MRATMFDAVAFAFVMLALVAAGYGIGWFAVERPAERDACESAGRVWSCQLEVTRYGAEGRSRERCWCEP